MTKVRLTAIKTDQDSRKGLGEHVTSTPSTTTNPSIGQKPGPAETTNPGGGGGSTGGMRPGTT